VWRPLHQRRRPVRGAIWLKTLYLLVSDLKGRAYADRVVRVRFEDLCTQPDVELDRIGRTFGLDLTELRSKAEGREPLVIGCPLSGNRLRHGGTVKFDPGGGCPRPPLPRWLEVVTIVLCGPLMWRYGYRFSGGDLRPTRSKTVTSG
jgi:hypothetical protein